MENIEAEIIRIIADQSGVDRTGVTQESHLVNDLNMDSLDCVELTMEFENEFSIAIPDEDVENLKTVGEVGTYLTGRMAVTNK